MERSFFDQVLDAFEGFVDPAHGPARTRTHGRGIKIWFADATREHYEAQLVRVDGDARLEIGFHAEHPDPATNQAVIDRIGGERDWRDALGEDPEAGVFLGADRWRRISELWDPPDPDDPEAAIEVAARLADYVDAVEPARSSGESAPG